MGRARPCGREGERRRPGQVWAAVFRVWLGWVLGSFPYLFLSPISFQTQLNYLNSKTTLNSSNYPLKPIKQMHQHVCTNKLALKINFNYLCNKIRLNAI